MTDLHTTLQAIESRAVHIQKMFDNLWEKCKKEGWFDTNKPLHEHLMWVEHEVSRNTWGITYSINQYRDAARRAEVQNQKQQ